MAPGLEVPTDGREKSIFQSADPPVEAADSRQDLIRRVVSSSTFEKSPKLRAFLQYVCRCAIESEPAAATEQQIGIHVFGRSPGYNPNEDNIVRSQARLLRLKLEHHFAHEGKAEPVVISIPKGRYLPTFDTRYHEPEEPVSRAAESVTIPEPRPPRQRFFGIVALSAVFVLTIVLLLTLLLRSKQSQSVVSAGGPPHNEPATGALSSTNQVVVAPVPGEVRISAGNTGGPYVDVWGHRWESDAFYEGGVSRPGPRDLVPPVADANLFRTIRESSPTDTMTPQPQGGFRYDIPVPKGVYELKLYFADPIRDRIRETGQDAQNVRHFQVNVNGYPLLSVFDAIADSGSAAVDIRAFKDISPAPDGKVHLEFLPASERPFVSALELTPGVAGKMKSVRFSAHKSDLRDEDGQGWGGDRYFVGGNTATYANLGPGPKIPELYTIERFGNFSYAIPVPPGKYTVKLHFLESFFSPSIPNGLCRGEGCRVFDVYCNGTALLRDFDVFKAAGGAYRPVVRTFHNLHPNGQGKLLLTFSPTLNYAEVRAIEVADEAP